MKRQLAAIPITLLSLWMFVGCTGQNDDDVAVNADVEILSPDNPKGRGLRAGTGGGGGDVAETDPKATPTPSLPLDP